MQWLIDIVYEAVLAHFKGVIVQWSGSIANIPTGWHLCDGTEGTPNLRDRFVIGAGTSFVPGGTGGNVNHAHAGTTYGHKHTIPAGTDIAAGTDYKAETAFSDDTFTSDETDGRPPFYALAYIQKI